MAEGADPSESAGLERFLDHLAPRDADAAALARELLAGDRAGAWRVTDLVGPVQMDVWGLTLTDGERTVCFGIERGVSDGVTASRAPGTPHEQRRRLGSLEEAHAWLAGP